MQTQRNSARKEISWNSWKLKFCAERIFFRRHVFKNPSNSSFIQKMLITIATLMLIAMSSAEENNYHPTCWRHYDYCPTWYYFFYDFLATPNCLENSAIPLDANRL
jgi:hypothetical protein